MSDPGSHRQSVLAVEPSRTLRRRTLLTGGLALVTLGLIPRSSRADPPRGRPRPTQPIPAQRATTQLYPTSTIFPADDLYPKD